MHIFSNLGSISESKRRYFVTKSRMNYLVRNKAKSFTPELKAYLADYYKYSHWSFSGDYKRYINLIQTCIFFKFF